MKVHIVAIAVVVMAIIFLSGCKEEEMVALQVSVADSNASYKSGEVIVVYKREVRKSAIDTLHRQCGASVKKELFKNGSKRIDLVKLPASMSVEEAIKYYQQRPEVESVEPNRIRRKYKTIPNDANISSQWHLDRTFDSSGATLIDMNATSAWDTTQGNSAMIVAVIDTGIDSAHPDLRTQLWHNSKEGVIADGVDNDGNGYIDDAIGYDFVNHDNDPNDDDVDGHGTHVAGLIAAEGNNSIGMSGVAWRASIMALKILDSEGYGDTANEIEAIRYAVDNGAKIINMSIGGECADEASNGEYEAIAYARDNGVLVVVASGNDTCNTDVTPTYPAGHPLDNIIAVGATNRFGEAAWFSNYGASSVHLSAPGEDIFSTVPLAKGSYALMSGTSMATPIVTGSALLVLGYDSNVSYKQLREKLVGSAIQSSKLEGKNLVEGNLDVGSALFWNAAMHRPIKPALTSVIKSDNSISLSWMDYSTVESGYRLKRATTLENNVTQTWDLSADTVSFTDTQVPLSEGDSYFYWVEAYNSVGVTQSNVVAMNIPLSAPVILSISASYGNRVQLDWNDTSNVEEGYIIYRSSSFWGGFSEIARMQSDSTTFTDTTTTAETTYYYMIKGYKSTNLSAESNLVQVLTPKEIVQEVSASSSGGGAFGFGDLLVLGLLLLGLRGANRREAG